MDNLAKIGRGCFSEIFKISDTLCFKRFDFEALKRIDVSKHEMFKHLELIAALKVPQNINIVMPLKIYNSGYTMQYIDSAITLREFTCSKDITLKMLRQIFKILIFCEQKFLVPDLNVNNFLVRNEEIFLIDIDSAQYRGQLGIYQCNFYNRTYAYRKNFLYKRSFCTNHYLHIVFAELILSSELRNSEKLMNWCARVAKQAANFETLPALKK